MKSAFRPYSFLFTIISFFISLLALANVLVSMADEGRISDNIALIPYKKVALVLGTSDQTRNGTPSPFFISRVHGAARLFREHKCSFILASGDNAHVSYNEPVKMKQALMAEGIPENRIVLDYAGFSTLDSIIRAKAVFGLGSFTVVTQRFQAERALFIAEEAGLDVVAYAVEDAGGLLSFNVGFRELFARLKAFLDMYFFNTEPVYLGKQEVIE